VTPDLERLSDWLLEHHSGTIDADRLPIIRAEIERLAVKQIAGEVVELGCYLGAMALWMRAVLDASGQQSRLIHVYDSFDGIPTPGPLDGSPFAPGDFKCSPDQVRALHERWDLEPPVIHKGWFHQTLPTYLPHRVAFAYLDSCFYDSILISLQTCIPRLPYHAALIIDDYADQIVNPKAWNELPGVKAACDAYFAERSPVEVLHGTGDLAFGRYENMEKPIIGSWRSKMALILHH
jgi:O-methyltransferase